MKLEELMEARQIIKDRNEWLAVIKEIGIDEIVKEVGEEEYPTDIHQYALKGNRLIGTWNMKKDEGTVYSGKGLSFDKRKRKFKKVK